MGLSLAASVRIGIAFLKLVGDPTRTEEIFRMSRNLRGSKDQRLRDAVVERHLALPGFRELYESRYLPAYPEMSKLLELPPDTLGFQFADHLAKRGLQPDFWDPIAIQHVGDYLIMRVRQTHDIWHVVLGYDTDVEGELAIQGAYLAQLGDGFAGLLLAAGILHTLKSNPLGYAETMDVIIEAYTRAKAAKPFITTKWEEHWATPVEDLRRELGIPPRKPRARATQG